MSHSYVAYFANTGEEWLFKNKEDLAKRFGVCVETITRELNHSDVELFDQQGVLIMRLDKYIEEELEVMLIRGRDSQREAICRRLKPFDPSTVEEIIPQKVQKTKGKKSRYSEKDIRTMIEMKEAGYTYVAIAKRFGIKSYSHVKCLMAKMKEKNEATDEVA